MGARPVIVVGVRRWIVVVSLLAVAAVFASRPLAAWLGAPTIVQVQAPAPPAPCVDGVFVLERWAQVQCDTRARLELAGAYAKCICVRP